MTPKQKQALQERKTLIKQTKIETLRKVLKHAKKYWGTTVENGLKKMIEEIEND